MKNESEDEPDSLVTVIARHIRHVLKLTNGRINGQVGDAELLGINPNTLRNRMKKLGISYGRVVE